MMIKNGMPALSEKSWESLAGFGIAIYSLGILSSTVLLSLGTGLMLIAFLAKSKLYWKAILRLPLFWLSCGFLAYLLGYSLFLQLEFPGTFSMQLNGSLDWIRIGFFSALLVGVWVAVRPQYLHLIPPFFAGGLLLKALVKLPETDWSMGLESRPGFGLPMNAFGLYSAIVLYSLLFFPKMYFPLTEGTIKGWRKWVWFLMIIMASLGVLVTLSRSALLAIGIVFPLFYLIVTFRKKRGSKSTSDHKKIFLYVGVLLTFCLVTIPFWKPLLERTNSGEIKHLKAFISGKEYAPSQSTSAGTRLVIWEKGAQLWLEKPLLGWGPRKADYLLEPVWAQVAIDPVKDFHNCFLEILVRLGLAGLLVFLLMFALVFRSIRKGLQSGWFSFDATIYIHGTLLLFVIAAVFNGRITDHMGRSFLSLLIGMAYSYEIHKRIVKDT